MSGSLSTYLETALLNHVFGGPDYVPPATFYIALVSVIPTQAGASGEISGGGYARLPVTWSMPAGSPPTVNNPNPLQWGAASADWGVVAGGAIYDDPLAGNYLGGGPLVSAVDGITPASILILAGMIFNIPATGVVLGFALSAGSPVPFHGPATRRLIMRPVAGEVIDGAGVARPGTVMRRGP